MQTNPALDFFLPFLINEGIANHALFFLRSFGFKRLSVFGKHPDGANIENRNTEWMSQ